MKVNFNNLRKQAAYALDDLTKKLNDARVKETQYHWEKDEKGRDKQWRGDMIVDSDDIQEHMDDLRMLIMTICCVYEEGNEEFADVSEQIDANGGVAYFNEEVETIQHPTPNQR